jgi:GT2 family glycosyltransferase
MHSDRPDAVAVCVVSHRRPEGLLRLLGALDALELPGDVRLRAVVVDNDADESARVVCEAAAERVSYPLRYVVEKRRGIPQARNRALAEALRDDFIAFVDDDEVPDPGWLAELMRVQRERDADAVAGPCLPRFEEAPPAWVVRGGFFERPRFETGEGLDVAFTHNVLVRAEALAAMPALFDERMALCGGSDVELFRRFARAGFRILWADAAAVHEVVPASRTTLRWVLRRALRVGASNSRVLRLHDRRVHAALRPLAHGLWCVAKAGVLLLGAGLRGPGAAARALHLACFGAGRIAGLLGLRVEEYRVTDGR